MLLIKEDIKFMNIFFDKIFKMIDNIDGLND